MSQPSDITTLGLLYEGSDFAAWRTKIYSLLRAHGIGHILDVRVPSTRRWNKTEQRPLNNNDCAEAYDLVRALLSCSLRSRIPRRAPSSLLEFRRWVNRLEQQAKPFRLMDLPVEIRNNIYELAIPSSFWTHGRVRVPKSDVPALLQVSSQIRKEASAIFYFRTEFCITSSLLRSNNESRCLEWVKKWAQTIVGQNVKHLKQVTITHRSRLREIKLKYDKANGLAINFVPVKSWHVGSRRKQQQRLEEHVRTINSACKAVGIKNEAIIVALTSHADFFDL